ncbi:MAG: phospho-N-acetylmuramoyl-pentapeptide-transferase [Planctomycetota bacterium]
MLHWLFEPLVPYFTGFNLFRYVTFRAAFAAILAFLTVLTLGPGIVAWLRERRLHGCAAHDSALLDELRRSKQHVPTMGGLLILLSVSVSTLLFARMDNLYVVVVFLGFLAFGALGSVDDWIKLTVPGRRGLSERRKLWVQVGIGGAALLVLYLHANSLDPARSVRGPSLEPSPYRASATVAELGGAAPPRGTRIGPTEITHPAADHRTDLQVPFFKHVCLDLGLAFLLLGLLVVVGSSNAVNLTDGMDGLATGCVAIASLTFALVTFLVGRASAADYLYVFHIPGAAELTVFCGALAGASLGFLWFNSFPATVFMGDTGSLALGGGLGLVAVCARQELTLLVAGGVFVAEAASVILQRRVYRWTGGRRLFRCAPLHHHFEFNRMHEVKVTVRFWIVAVLLALFALALFKLR